jgi:hypothetical protein
MFVGLKSLHLLNGAIKFGQGFRPIRPVQHLTSIRLTDMRLLVLPSMNTWLVAVKDFSSAYVHMLTASGNTSLILENCTIEVTFDSPTLDRLSGCVAKEGAQVGL